MLIFVVIPLQRMIEDIEDVISMAKNSNSIIAYTIAIPELKEYLDLTGKGRRNYGC